MLWVTIFGIIIIPLIGWVFNTLITRKIDECNTHLENTDKRIEAYKESFFNRLDAVKSFGNETYVKKEMYEQAMEYHQKEVDGKFNSLVESINKMDKDVKEKFDEVKDLINEKFNGKNKGV